MSCDLISFDLDGTLVDTASEIAEAANRALESHGIARRPVAEITLLIGAGIRELMLKLLARCFLEQPALAQTVQPDAVLKSLDDHYAATTGSSALPYVGCHDALAELRRAGFKLACVTNKELRHTHRVLQATRLGSAFDLVIGGDSLPEKSPTPACSGMSHRRWVSAWHARPTSETPRPTWRQRAMPASLPGRCRMATTPAYRSTTRGRTMSSRAWAPSRSTP